MSRPISKRMLTCSAVLYKTDSYDEDRNLVTGNSVTLNNVFITQTLAVNKGTNGDEAADTMMLIYDPKTSSSSELFTWEKGQKVIFDGLTFYVNSITPCYSEGLHHYEIGLK